MQKTPEQALKIVAKKYIKNYWFDTPIGWELLKLLTNETTYPLLNQTSLLDICTSSLATQFPEEWDVLWAHLKHGFSVLRIEKKLWILSDGNLWNITQITNLVSKKQILWDEFKDWSCYWTLQELWEALIAIDEDSENWRTSGW